MTDLSPATRAVLDALYEGWHVATPGQCLAAALRAAADECDPNWLATTVFHHLYAIADELEGVKYDTYRCELDNTSQHS
jgi:predicted HD phosphohydrolase